MQEKYEQETRPSPTNAASSGTGAQLRRTTLGLAMTVASQTNSVEAIIGDHWILAFHGFITHTAEYR